MNIYSYVFCFSVRSSPQSMTLPLLLAKVVRIKKKTCFVLIFVETKLPRRKVSMHQFVHIENFLLADFSMGIVNFLLHYLFAIFFPTGKKILPNSLEHACNCRSMKAFSATKLSWCSWGKKRNYLTGRTDNR